MSAHLSFVGCALSFGVLGVLALSACKDPSPSGVGGQAGAAGADGCPDGPQPMFTLTITAEDGPVPPDTSVAITWSTGPEPVFSLSDPSTWRTIEQGANVVCDVDLGGPPPQDLQKLVCRLWTSGATKVAVSAGHYQSYTETLVPRHSEPCDGPVPEDIAIALLREVDAGAPP